MTLSAGAKLGTYEILAMIGKGGMGEVYRARDTKLKREVAIKALGTPVTASTRSWRLPGPTVARTYDVLPDGRFLGLLPSGDEGRLSASATPEIRFILNWFEELKQRH